MFFSLQLTVCCIFIISNALISAAPNPITHKRDHYLLSCGLSTVTTTWESQTWQTDDNSTFTSPAAISAATSATAAAAPNPYAANNVYCANARIFRSSFTYSFPVSPGPKFIRLNFCPLATYASTPATQFFLTLTADGGAGPFTLLRNYSAYLYLSNFSSTEVIHEEFLVDVNASRLNLTFIPISSAFVNSIEIVSVPESLYTGLTPCENVKNVVNPASEYSFQEPVALQTVVRLNVGDYDVQSIDDSGEMLRVWSSDVYNLDRNFTGYTQSTPKKVNYEATSMPEYTAPSGVYGTARVMGPYDESFKPTKSLVWEIGVNPGFDYLVRLHFCEIDGNITGSNQREFNIYMNNQMAERQVDVMSLANDVPDAPVCKDYVVSYEYGNDESPRGFVTLSIALHPDTQDKPLPNYNDAILNGLEIFKISNYSRSLANPNPSPMVSDGAQSNQQNPLPSSTGTHFLFPIIGGVATIVLCSFITFAYCCWRIRVKKASSVTTDKSNSNKANGSSSLPSHLCKQFNFDQIKVATNDFNDNLVIGRGGFGKVYLGSIPVEGEMGTTVTTVAVKRLNPNSNQGAHEFFTEIEMLSRLRHVHLVSLIGYCKEGAEMILVYEYMPRGTLRDHLYTHNTNPNPNPPLLWKQRLEICIGAARGLHYLHVGAKQPIIHRDVKSTNILLDEKWTAKLSDFGLCKVGTADEAMHVSTQVKGSVGYLDPEYHRLHQITHKSDLYSFGVVLFEVLCARPAMNPTLPREEVNLAMWARTHCREGSLGSIVDPNLTGRIAPECLRKFGEVAEKCVRDQASERPSIEDVVWGLEFALQLQLTADENIENNNDVGVNDGTIISGGNFYQSISITTTCPSSTTKSDAEEDHTTLGNVFSDIMKPHGR